MFLQFEIWKDCYHNCPFCFNREIPAVRNKKKSLEYTLNVLNEIPHRTYDSIGLIGGEFFDGQLKNSELNNLFYKVIDCIINKIKEGKTKRVLITASLMYQDSREWFVFCRYLKSHNVEDKFLICTSWDSIYRFNSMTKTIWETIVCETQKRFPKLKIHIEMIITQHFLEEILSQKLIIKDFEKQWNCRVNLNVPYLPFASKYKTKEEMAVDLPLFFPKRKTFFDALEYFWNTKDIDLNEIVNYESNHSTCLHYTLDDKVWIVLPERDTVGSTCTNFKNCDVSNCCGYIDSKIRIQQDVKRFLEIV